MGDTMEDIAEQSTQSAIESVKSELVCQKKNGRMQPTDTINNYLTIFQGDPTYSGIKFNALTRRGEVVALTENGITSREWDDTDNSWSLAYVERTYGIYNTEKHRHALNLFFKRHEYNPLKDLIDNLEWDGKNRCEHFLCVWAKADDTPYVREVSRLIFAGGINRLYSPGCKFDDTPVLVGTKQGEGKSTLIRWLAMHDYYYGEINAVEGNVGIEQLSGKWILEVGELAAFTRAKEIESVKAYITRQTDTYRKPYDREVSNIPRACIFIGTTNNRQFLVDKTGNRRFYPVITHSVGYDLFDHELECKEYIVQCWAEAKARYDKGEMSCFADRRLLSDYQAAQEGAMQDDWRPGAMEEYLDSKQLGYLVCIREIKHRALSTNPDFPDDPTPRESSEIGTLMDKIPGWERVGVRKTDRYGKQRCWQKISYEGTDGDPDELPF